MLRRSLVVVSLAAIVAGCSGGSSSPPPFFTGTVVPTPTPTPLPATAGGTLTTSTTQSSSISLGPIGPGDTGTTGCPPTNVVAHLSIVFSTGAPGGTPALAAMKRRPFTIGGAGLAAFGYYTVTPDVNVNCPNLPAFTFTFPAGATLPVSANAYVAMYDPGNAASGWNTISGPATQTGNTFSWTTSSFAVQLVAGRTYAFALFTTTTANLPLATPSPTPTPQHLYVSGNLFVNANYTPGQIIRYDLPITSASQAPNFVITTQGNPVGLGVDANGDLGVGFRSGLISFYTAPVTGASLPSATFPNGSATNTGQLAFTNAGDLWAATGNFNVVYAFTHPFTSASTPSGSVSNPQPGALVGAGFDAAQNLYVSNFAGGNNVLVWAPPYTGAPTATPLLPAATTAYRQLAVSATQLFVCSVVFPIERVDVYTLPITSTSAPAFAITNGVALCQGVALDGAGNLYVGGNGNVEVYAPPFSAASSAAITLNIGSFTLTDIAVGK
jgi:hypothetical protein